MKYNYSVSAHAKDYRGFNVVTSEAIRSEYARLGLAVPAWFEEIHEKGCRYSFQDFDTLSAAMCDLYKRDSNVWERIGTYRAA